MCFFLWPRRFPDFIASMIDLVKALNNHASSPGWKNDVSTKLYKMAEAVSDHRSSGNTEWCGLRPDVMRAELPGLRSQLAAVGIPRGCMKV